MKAIPILLLLVSLLQVEEAGDLTIKEEVELGIKFLKKSYNAYDIRIISLRAIQQKERALKTKLLKFWLNNLSFEQDIEELNTVPNSKGQLLWFYLKDFGWNSAAWTAVADRDPYYTEKTIDSYLAERARQLINVFQTKVASLQLIVRADFLFRESIESDRSPTYYDLLFAKQRFGTVSRTIYHPGGDYTLSSGKIIKNLKPGNYQAYYNTKFRDFPENEKEWDKAFGVDKFDDFVKSAKIDLRHGAVVDEGISIVALSNRLLERKRGPIGDRYKTFDVKSTSGKRDFAETLYFDFEFDAGELIARLPNGGQAYLLVNAQGKILEVADNKIARDSTDPKDTRVRNPGSCVVCHEKGIITPINLVEQLLKDGIDIHFRNKRKARNARGFFLNWEEELESDQRRYIRFIARTSGFKPAENSKEFKAFRDWYDRPINLEQAVRETGVPTELFKVIAAKSPRVRLLQLVQGRSIPRNTWQGDNKKNRGMFQEFMLLYRAGTKK